MSSNIFNHKYPRVAAAFTQDRDFVWKHLFSGYKLPQKSRFKSQTKVLTMGSYFAINISNALRNYWPTFEVFRWMGSHFGSSYGADDELLRHPNKHLVNLATEAFKDAFFRLNSSMTALPPSPPQDLVGDL